MIIEDFKGEPSTHWTFVSKGGGYIKLKNGCLRLGFDSAEAELYTDAQIDDYSLIDRSKYQWRPPLDLNISARFSHPAYNHKSKSGYLKGTVGFGFWNRPFSMQGKWFTLPKSIWFFHAGPPSEMRLSRTVDANAFKTQVVATSWLRIFLYGIPMVFGWIFGKLTGWPGLSAWSLENLSGDKENEVVEIDITKWHDYTIKWREKVISFYIDEVLISESKHVPKGPLGFVAWVDNEYAIANPSLNLDFGHVKSDAQWMEIKKIEILNQTEDKSK